MTGNTTKTDEIYHHFKDNIAPELEQKYDIKLHIQIADNPNHQIKIIPGPKSKLDGDIRKIIRAIEDGYQRFPSIRIYDKIARPEYNDILLHMQDCQILSTASLNKEDLSEPSAETRTAYDELISDYEVIVKKRDSFNDHVFIYKDKFVSMSFSKGDEDYVISHIRKCFKLYLF